MTDDGTLTDDLDAVLSGVGPRLRAIRKQRRVTLARVAELTGMSVSTLSRIESGRRRATLEVLLPLARAYRMPLDGLVGAPATGDPRIHPRPVTRQGVVWVPLSRDPGGINAYKQVLPVPATVPDVLDQQVHEGYEWIYVLGGRMRLALGDQDFEMGAGEAAEFDTRTPHAVANIGEGPLELLILFGQHGKRAHLRTAD
ncbi:helix-turn-helix domain-containing protein [Myceligenerans pegani]|uniref:Helix-turn-helix domain-containing protein n=1 Tax=Myceligenerans pegani TaxID=2776917 RepID=A0ABR9MZT0_9MICO|nr:helix-turn-helix transcriptional regulator [Myceligenerans sp. TRM 65318]MBE1876338.1 helix-turn-helix domain-containing protein [Myceligenerans sp. TRM 65318]MBE3018609.1 helix-turn-helix domain-containing protein [Myceligenerans sp. TRM 65318]